LDTTVLAIVYGAKTVEESRAFAARFGEGVEGIPDPDGEIARSAGVRYWPTTMTIDELGLVTSVDVGIDGYERRRGGQTT
jgi:hypothetical protein